MTMLYVSMLIGVYKPLNAKAQLEESENWGILYLKLIF